MHGLRLLALVAVLPWIGACYTGRVTYATAGGVGVDTRGRVGVEAAADAHLLTVETPEDGTGVMIGAGGTLGYRFGGDHVVDSTMGASLGAIRLPDDWGYKILFGMRGYFSTDGNGLAPTISVGLSRALDDTPRDRRILDIDLVARLQSPANDLAGWFGLMVGYRRLRSWGEPIPRRD